MIEAPLYQKVVTSKATISELFRVLPPLACQLTHDSFYFYFRVNLKLLKTRGLPGQVRPFLFSIIALKPRAE
jgi:hypothetical protein